jgi:capsular exopolysaccharide synthesis family protein
MGKIFEALVTGKREATEFLIPLLQGQDRSDGSVEIKAPPSHDETPNDCIARKAVEDDISLVEIRSLCLNPAGGSPILPFDGVGDSQATDQYRILRTKITQHRTQPRIILISSPGTGDGKSVSAVNLAGALSLNSDAKVLLMDADFRRATIHAHLGLPPTPGLTDVLAGTSQLGKAIVSAAELPNLFILPSGSPTASPAELLEGVQWRALISQLRKLFRFVVIDTPPVEVVAEYSVIQATCEGILLVIRVDHTKREMYRLALRAIPPAKFLGVLVNCVPDWWLSNYPAARYYPGAR